MRQLLIVLLIPIFCNSQNNVVKSIMLDSVMISAVKKGFNIQDFIHYVKHDTSFYQGFKNLRFYEHDFNSRLEVLDEDSTEIGTIKIKGNYDRFKNLLKIHRQTSQVTGKIINRRGKYRYYTPKFFEKIFYPKDTLEVTKISSSKNKDDKRENDAKTIIFTPGSDQTEHGGRQKRKLAIFHESMQKYYNYTISQKKYKEHIDCYVFNCKMKDSLSNKEKDEVLIRELTSYFDKKTFKVVYRKYNMKYNYWLIDLDVTVKVEMGYVNNVLIPLKINYEGNWDIPFAKREIVRFNLSNTNFIITD